ncbi:iojap-like ribosome-associated protein [Frankia torreyi]|uniref:Ribosomal silencing factor RsfS n=1 Tax=Frankia torreyi TaxID=1856 RepID=A0A0D8BMX1_9ACTN|nr:iojap-like ribosome-associated protein [Frankia torreyi]KQM06150.1 ribosome silencing factor RsfS/YbeB/iojap [Frankia sp. CpI1-P]
MDVATLETLSVTASPRAVELALAAAQAAADKLGHDLLILDVSERLAITDCFVIASAGNERQVKGIVDEVEEQLRRLGAKPLRREGEREGHWVLLDFVDVVVHVQRDEERVFYALERLWKDCPVIPFTDATVGVGAGAGTSAPGSSSVPGSSSAPGPLGGGSVNAL